MKTAAFTSWLEKTGRTIKGVVKIAVGTGRCRITPATDGAESLIIMANGPSLRETIRDHAASLDKYPLLAVNFAANTDEFYRFRPEYYVMADPAFFTAEGYENVARLWQNIRERVDWPMRMLIPLTMVKRVKAMGLGDNITVEGFNMVGVEGYEWFENIAYGSGRAMPRPRNVLIPSLMCAIKMGFKRVYVTGADHSWTRTLEVDDSNTVVSVQPHYYEDNKEEHSRAATIYKDIRIHQIIHSFYVAFRAYHLIERFARRAGCSIINSTPGSFIDAFPRGPLPE